MLHDDISLAEATRSTKPAPATALDDKDSPLVEELCRELLKQAGADPDELVQAGVPETRGTPQGSYFTVRPNAAVPLWRTFIATSRMFLKAAERVIEARKQAELGEIPVVVAPAEEAAA